MDQLADLPDVVESLSRWRLERSTMNEVLSKVARVVTHTLATCDAAGVSIVTDQGVTVGPFTDERLAALDIHQYDIDEGPCVQAMKTGRVVAVDAALPARSSDNFSSKALEMSVASALGVPLTHHASIIGSLNMYAHARHAFSHDDEVSASIIASEGSRLIADMQRYLSLQAREEELTTELERSDIVAVATGRIMMKHHCSRDHALAYLRSLGESENLALHEVAQRIWPEPGPGDESLP